MTVLAAVLVAIPVALALYAYVVYPIGLRIVTSGRRAHRRRDECVDWPTVSIVVVAHNAEHIIRDSIEQLLAVEYPADRRQVIIVSDASTDGTDAIVAEFATRGVELHRIDTRAGKTAAENAIGDRVRGEIVVNADASVLVAPNSLKALVRNFVDPTVGVASGRAVGVSRPAGGSAFGDAAYYRYEMWVRSLEMGLGAVIGATGALYAVRRELFVVQLPAHATRDFAGPLLAYERGFRSVIEEDAICFVLQTPSLAREYHRKMRTMVRGLDTLYELRRLMDPIHHGSFALMLTSHKLCRWLVYLLAPLGVVGVFLLALQSWPARILAALLFVFGLLGGAALEWPSGRRIPRLLAVCGYALVGGGAGAAAWVRFFRGEHMVVWEPTRRMAGDDASRSAAHPRPAILDVNPSGP